MDPDRKSTVSSFYGPQRSSYDALNNDFQSPTQRQQDPRNRRDSSSTFFTGAHRLPPGAGYNRASYLDAGREEPVKGGYDEEVAAAAAGGGWDVFADFNNAGPRYSTAFGMAQNPASYQPIGSSHGSLKQTDDEEGTPGPVELVTVPALGPEWKAEEMRGMTRKGKNEDRNERRTRWWRAWGRGQAGMCGQRWLTRRVFVFIVFIFIAIVITVLAIAIPRVPDFAFNSDTPLIPATGSWNDSIPTEFSRAPANFSFPAFLDIQVDTGSNFLPLTFTGLDATVFDLDSRHTVGVGHIGHTTVPAKQFSHLQLPLNFTYVATNDSDATWVNWYNACRNKALIPDGNRPGLRFSLNIKMHIAGLVGTHDSGTSVTNAPCPFQLSQNAV